ncbi:MAG TPA: ATP synthase F1 subunit epsilon [Candidatus Binataceae bacterium]|jgi:F-type H+-transporting ATPase subunit epsilon|nr:ATP synthase F1 subunit epsilon [Candidatus Binataceae bacterium]
MATFSFKLVTPTGVVFDGPVEQVNAVGPLGEFGVLADHTNFITSLAPGLMTIRTGDGQSLAYLVMGGLVEIKDGAMTALASSAEPPEKAAPADPAELQAAEERLAAMSAYDPAYDEAQQAVAMLRARRVVSESRTGASH